jgi:hypothetical protein
MQHPTFAVGPGDHVAEPVTILVNLALGIKKEVDGDALMGQLEPEPASPRAWEPNRRPSAPVIS